MTKIQIIQRDFTTIENIVRFPRRHVPRNVIRRSVAYTEKNGYRIDYIQCAGPYLYQLRVVVFRRSDNFLPALVYPVYFEDVPVIYQEVLQDIFDKENPYVAGCMSLNITIQFANIDSTYIFSFPYSYIVLNK